VLYARCMLRLALVAVLATCAPQIQIARDPAGRIQVDARSAPLRQVLDCLVEKTGIRVTYDWPAQQPVTAAFVADSPPQAVLRLLEGLGINYAMRGVAPTGQDAGTLIILSGPGSGGVAGGQPPVSRPGSPPLPTYEAPTPAESDVSEGTRETPNPVAPEPPPPGAPSFSPPPLPPAPSILPTAPDSAEPAAPMFPEPRPLTLTQLLPPPA
jgi:hypothetical protein